MLPVSIMPYVGLLLGGFPLRSLQLLLLCVNDSSMLVLSLSIDLLLLLSPLSDPNRHAPSRRPLVLSPIVVKAVDFYLCPSAFCL